MWCVTVPTASTGIIQVLLYSAPPNPMIFFDATANVHREKKWGRFVREATPGLNIMCCCLGERYVGSVSMRVQQIDVRCETKTQDNVFVDVHSSVQYQVRIPRGRREER